MTLIFHATMIAGGENGGQIDRQSARLTPESSKQMEVHGNKFGRTTQLDFVAWCYAAGDMRSRSRSRQLVFLASLFLDAVLTVVCSPRSRAAVTNVRPLRGDRGFLQNGQGRLRALLRFVTLE